MTHTVASSLTSRNYPLVKLLTNSQSPHNKLETIPEITTQISKKKNKVSFNDRVSVFTFSKRNRIDTLHCDNHSGNGTKVTNKHTNSNTNKHTNTTTNKQTTKIKMNNLKLLTVNVRGLKGKLNSVKSCLHALGTDIAGITETHLRPSEHVQIDGYTWIGLPRKVGQGGGIGFFVRNDIYPLIQIMDHEDDLELKWIKVKTKPCIHVGILYGSQENINKNEITKNYKRLEYSIQQQAPNEIILMGDFNAKIEIDNEQIRQAPSRNGKLLSNIIDRNQLTPTNQMSLHKGTWTRINSNNPSEKSVIDYMLISNGLQPSVTESETDDNNIYNIEGINSTDHKTITMSLMLSKLKVTNIIHKWKAGSTDQWKAFNKQVITNWNNRKQNEPQRDQYDSLHKHLMAALKQCIGQLKIDTNRKYKVKSEEIKKARSERKQAKVLYKSATKSKDTATIHQALSDYIKKQKEVRKLIDQESTTQANKRIDNLISQGGTNSNLFWKIRKQLQNVKEELYDTVTEEGIVIKDGENAKTYIANYFEDLYQAREGEQNQQQWSQKIEDKVSCLATTNPGPMNAITTEELNRAIKQLKRGKSVGPDEIPNEALIESNKDTREIIKKVFNRIYETSNIPRQWKMGTIKRLYKGKGTKGKCSNERGITLSSNMGKLFERIINNRIQEEINITKNQGGGTKGKSISDHLLRINNFIKKSKRKKQTTYLVFLDVTKAYDKAWNKAILYTLNKSGIAGQDWLIAKELNENITAKVKTKHGLTRTINIKDSIRQGGILSVIEYANMMDEITKEIMKNPDNMIKYGNENNAGCLLWMDDVVLIHNNPQQLQTMLDTTHEIASRYRIKFGEVKSKIMIIPSTYPELEITNPDIEEIPAIIPTFKIGDIELEEATTYKYLGITLNNKATMSDHMESVKNKAEASFQSIINVAASSVMKPLEMQTIWKLYKACTLPIMTFGCESWIALKPEINELQKKHYSMLKRVLKVPTQTPDIAIDLETGIPSIPQIINMRQISYYRKQLLYENTGFTQKQSC